MLSRKNKDFKFELSTKEKASDVLWVQSKALQKVGVDLGDEIRTRNYIYFRPPLLIWPFFDSEHQYGKCTFRQLSVVVLAHGY